MIVAIPLTSLWMYSSFEYRPVDSVDLDDPDGQCRVGDYLLFAQTWTVVPVVSVTVLAGYMVRYWVNELRVSIAYMTEVVAVALILGAVSIRFVRAATDIRRTYNKKLRSRGETWAEISATKAAPDPTIRFIGEHWWRLPAVILGFLGVLSGLLAWFGLIDLFTS